MAAVPLDRPPLALRPDASWLIATESPQANTPGMKSRSAQRPLRKQRTLAGPAVVEGFGYWSGRDVRVEFQPAEPDSGIVFVRRDIGPAARIAAHVRQRVESPRRTTLRAGGAAVEMVEHILAALAGLRIDNCEVWVDAPEMPGADGSSLPFVDAILAAGIQVQTVDAVRLVVTEPTRVGDDSSWIEARPPLPGNELSVRFRVDYGSGTAIGRQTCQVDVTPENFRAQLAPARTFVLKAEADWLRGQGLGLRPTARDLLIFDDAGPIDNTLRFPDECARHKALDLVGDLALAGCEVSGQFVAQCSGHRLNSELVKALLVEGERLGNWRRSA
jgi:UDP-3-O-[3-hydroxymyristoyl] N-acetylglucosamine deacetylase